MSTLKSITSKDNPQFKQLKNLIQNARDRRESGLYAIEGIHLAQAARQAGLAAQHTFVAQTALNEAQVNALVQSLPQGSTVYMLSDTLFRALSVLEQGVSVIQTFDLTIEPLHQVVASCNTRSANAVYLENIQDPGNLGTVLRTAAAAGCQSVFLSAQCADAWSPKVLRAGMGAHFALTIVEQCVVESLFSTWAATVIATSLHAQNSIYNLDLTGSCLWCFGNEGSGLLPDTERRIEQHAKGCLAIIPQSAAIESLNISAAAAVCLFEQVRQQLTAL